MISVSVVVTVKNEEKTILKLLSSLSEQSFTPNEIIIVDGGSIDETLNIIRSFIRSKPLFKLILAQGSNIPRAKNIGIAEAKSDVIAHTDAGVTLDKDWLMNLMRPFESDSADFVGGVWVGTAESLFQKCVVALQYPSIESLGKDFLPSTRSVAFRRRVWEAVNGYPENLPKADDTYFDLRVKEARFRIALAKDAVVYWSPRPTLRELFDQYSSYAEWDVRAGLFFKLRIYRLLVLAYLVVAFFVISIIQFGLFGLAVSFLITSSYLVFSGFKALRATKRLRSFAWAVAIKLSIFAAETLGIAKGIRTRISSSK